MLDRASEAALVEFSHDEDTVTLLVRRISTRRNDLSTGRMASLLKDESTSGLVPMMLRPLVLQPCDPNMSCHFGVFETLHLSERFY